MTVQQAQAKGLVQSFVFGAQTVIITSAREPVSLAFPEVGWQYVRVRSRKARKVPLSTTPR